MHASFYEKILDSLYDGVYFVDRRRIITYWNAGAERISGYSREEVLGRPCCDNILRHIDGNGVEICGDGCPLSATMLDGKPRKATVTLQHKQGKRVPVFVKGSPVYDEDGSIAGAVEVFSVNTKIVTALESIKKLHEEILVDPLTRIGNRKAAETHLTRLLQDHDTPQAGLGVLFVDIDLFKHVNDTYGHCAGDEVLRSLARTLSSGLRDGEKPFRWGGEEFVIVLPAVTPKILARIANRLRRMIEATAIAYHGETIRITASFGGALRRSDDADWSSLVERADRQVYRSKAAGRNRVRINAR